MTRALVVVAAALACACGSPAPAPVTWSHDVAPIVQARCLSCHVEGGIAPFALDTYERAVAMKDAMKQAVVERRMPPFLAGPGCAEYLDDERLSDAEISTLTRWVDTGAAKGPGVTSSTTDTQAPHLDSLPRVDAKLTLAEPYTSMKPPDDYRCFVLDWNQTTSKYVTGFHVIPGNARVVHHVIAFLVPPDLTQTVADLDAAEAGPGYTCYGGPGFGRAGNGWLGSWAPGVPASMYPDGTGVRVEPGSKVVLQVHYNLGSVPVEQRADQTTVELALADDVRRRAWIMPWADPDWVRNHKMAIPAGAADTAYSFSFDPTPYLGVLTNQQLPSGQAFRLHTVATHQHRLGTKSHVDLVRGGNPDTKECLLDIPRWDFHWQRGYRLAKSTVFRPGDQLRLECHWDNRPENQPVLEGVAQPVRDVNWGEGTADEMCLGVFYISE